jgi:hypothetical protein
MMRNLWTALMRQTGFHTKDLFHDSNTTLELTSALAASDASFAQASAALIAVEDLRWWPETGSNRRRCGPVHGRKRSPSFTQERGLKI